MSPLSVSTSRKLIWVQKHICKAVLCHWPVLPTYTSQTFPCRLPVSLWTSKTGTTFPGGRKSNGPGQSISSQLGDQICGTVPLVGNILCKTLTRTIIQKQPVSHHIYGLHSLGGDRRSALLGSRGSSCCLQLTEFSYLVMVTITFHTILASPIALRGSHQPISKSFSTHYSPIFIIPGNYQLFMYIVRLPIGLFIFYLLICKHSFHIKEISSLFATFAEVIFFPVFFL